MQNLPREHEVSLNVNSLVTHMGIRGLKINPTKIQQSSNLVKCLEIQWRRVFRDINSEVKNKSLHLGTPTTKKEAQQLVCISELWRHHTPSLDLLPQPVSQVAQTLARFLLGAKNRRRFCKRSRMLCRLLCQFHGQKGICLEPLAGTQCFEYWQTSTLSSSRQSNYFPF